MSESAEKEISRGPPFVACALLVLMSLPVLYVLSLGPAIWLVENQYLSTPLAQWFYWPLELLGERSEFFTSCVRWYVEFFR